MKRVTSPFHGDLRVRGFQATAIATLAALGCGAGDANQSRNRRCALTAWFLPQAHHDDRRPELVGSFFGWSRTGPSDLRQQRANDGTIWESVTVALPAGSHQYAFALGDQLVLDDNNPQTAFLAAGDNPYGTEVSQVEIPDCAQPELRVVSARATGPAALNFAAEFATSRAGWRLAPDSVTAVVGRLGNSPVAAQTSITELGGVERVTVHASDLAPGKYTVKIAAADRAGVAAEPAQGSAFVEPPDDAAAPTLADGLVYELMVDRFRGESALAAPARPGDRAGGTLAGVTAAVRSGYFERLGVTTLWLSPVMRNPPGRLRGRDGHLYEAYHGYWPSEPRAVEDRLGGETQLDELVAEGHSRGLRIILDVVPNHVHESHPYYRDHSRRASTVQGATDPRRDSWFNDGPTACVCGSPGCSWGERIEDCWFDTYLPDLNWRHPDVMTGGTADLLWWMDRFDVDGFRIDAIPMMPRAASRRMVRRLRRMSHREGLDILLLGETFTGPGSAGRDQLRAYLGRNVDGLDSEFDFPLMWAVRSVLARGESGFDALETEIAASDQAWSGSGAVMAHILDNHDTTRFLSEAAGDAGADPWTAPPVQPTAAEPYRRLMLATTLIESLPGLPVLYYGDELGLAGGADPDSRRVLPDVLGGTLPARQAEMLAQVGRLGRLRHCSAALRRGRRQVLAVDAEHDIALLTAPANGEVALVVLSRDRQAVTVKLSGAPAGRYCDALSGAAISVEEPTAIPLEPLSAAIYLRQDDPCLLDVPLSRTPASLAGAAATIPTSRTTPRTSP